MFVVSEPDFFSSPELLHEGSAMAIAATTVHAERNLKIFMFNKFWLRNGDVKREVNVAVIILKCK